MMMQNDNDEFQTLLADYAAPTADDGFTDAFMQSINIAELQARQARQMKLRLYSLYGAAFLGGIIAALQLPALMNYLGRFKIDTTATTNLSLNFNILGMGLICAIALWVMLDNKTSDIF